MLVDFRQEGAKHSGWVTRSLHSTHTISSNLGEIRLQCKRKLECLEKVQELNHLLALRQQCYPVLITS